VDIRTKKGGGQITVEERRSEKKVTKTRVTDWGPETARWKSGEKKGCGARPSGDTRVVGGKPK